MPDVTFALVGPPQTDVSALERCANVTPASASGRTTRCPRYVKRFDVGIVPYRLTEYTANVYPTKLNEYLVMGIPVVATDLPEIRRFNAEHGDIVAVAADADAFAAAVRAAFDDGAAHRKSQTAYRGRPANSWQSRIAAMKRLIDEATRAPRGDRAAVGRDAAPCLPPDTQPHRAGRRRRWSRSIC